MSGPTVVSTFAGCGGSSLGYKLAGYDVRLAVEWDANAVETYRANFPGTTVHHGDVRELSAESAAEMAGVAPGELDVLDGSPPCQGFSTAGTRDVADPRNQLFLQYARLLRGLRPRAFVMENVRGMVVGTMRRTFSRILDELRGCGYRVAARLLNAKFYGVPQDRPRVIIVGAREDLGVDPGHPPPTTPTPVTVREALAGCPVSELPPFDDCYARLWPRVPRGKAASAVLKRVGRASGFTSCKKVHPDRPSPTITSMRRASGFATTCHWAEPRALAVSELQRLCSFPDDFVFVSHKAGLVARYVEQSARVGNSVPPLLMRAVAEHVRRTILG